MRIHVVPALLFALVFTTFVGCKSDPERSTESLQAFADAVVIHRAPYLAYAMLDPADKQHITVESWASGFEEREPVFAAGTTLTVGDVSLQGDRAESTVKITPPVGDPETRKYVLRRDGTKWRVWLGLKQLETMRKTLDEAQRLADDGALDLAREKVESVAENEFPASMPTVIEAEILALRQVLGNQQRTAQFDGRFKAAMSADLETMRTETEALAKEVGPDDETFYPRLQALQQELKKLERQAAIDGFEFADVKAKPIRDPWGTYREVRFTAKNNTGRPLSKLAVRLELKNEGTDTPIGTVVWQLIEEGATVAADGTIPVKREVEKAPEAWNGKDLNVRVDDLVFADGEPDDAG